MLWLQREEAPEGQGQFGGEVMPKLSCKGWMGIHQEMCGEMIIPGKGFSIWKENITLWEMDILY